MVRDNNNCSAFASVVTNPTVRCAKQQASLHRPMYLATARVQAASAYKRLMALRLINMHRWEVELMAMRLTALIVRARLSTGAAS
jgi:hypothetical protein